MGKIIVNGETYSGTTDTANNINYDNSVSGLQASTAQEAIDELKDGMDAVTDRTAEYSAGNLLSIVTSPYCTISSCDYKKIGEITILSFIITTNSKVPVGGVLIDNIPLRPNINTVPLTLRKYSGTDDYKAYIGRGSETNVNQIKTLVEIPSGTAFRAEFVYTARYY